MKIMFRQKEGNGQKRLTSWPFRSGLVGRIPGLLGIMPHINPSPPSHSLFSPLQGQDLIRLAQITKLRGRLFLERPGAYARPPSKISGHARCYTRPSDMGLRDACSTLSPRAWDWQAGWCRDTSTTTVQAVSATPAGCLILPFRRLVLFRRADAHRIPVEAVPEAGPTYRPAQRCIRASCSAAWSWRRNHAVVVSICSTHRPCKARVAGAAAWSTHIGYGVVRAAVWQRAWPKG